MKTILSVEHLSVSYGEYEILRDVTFEIDRGQVVAVVGPNGCGKTTLIQAILGFIPYQGKISIQGHPVREVCTKIGYVPQNYHFDRTIPMTVSEFLKIAFPELKDRKIRHLLEEVDMQDKKDRMVGELSGGELQRVLIARAIATDPSLLLLDEAISGVDVGGSKSFYEIVSHLNQVHDTTVILVSHEINMVYRFAGQIICLNHDLICMGKPKEVLTREVLEKLYGKEMRFQEHKH